MKAVPPPSAMSGQVHQYHTVQTASGRPPPHHDGRAIANRLDDAIAQLRTLKQNGRGPEHSGSHNLSTSSESPTNTYQKPASPSTMHHHSPAPNATGTERQTWGQSQTLQSSVSDYGGRITHQTSEYPAATNRGGVAHSIPSYRSMSTSSTSSPDENGVRRVKSPPPPTAKKPTIPQQLRRSPSNPVSPATITSNSHSSPSTRRKVATTVTLDSQGRCTCCPFGYHVDVDFVKFSMEEPPPPPTLPRTSRRSRQSTDSQSSSPRSTTGATTYTTLVLDENSQPVRPETQTTYTTTHLSRSQSAAERLQSPITPRGVTPTTIESSYRTPNGSLTHADSEDTMDSVTNYSTNSMKTTRRIVTSTQLAETMANHLPNSQEDGETLTISAESVEQIKKHMALSLQRMQELEEQIKVIPLMQERISRLKMDKKSLGEQLSQKSTFSSMRSVGVGDYDVDEEETRVEKVIQTVIQEAPPKPSREVGVGNYDVTVEYVTEAEAYHTIAERVQRIKEKEIQTWIQEGEKKLEARKAAMRSCGVGDGDVNEEPEPVRVTEKEVKTVYIEPEKPEQRNVGLQVKPSMRDVCIEFSQQESKPLTRTCGFNVDLNDILQETQQQQSEETETTEYGEVQQAGALATGQKNAWQTQKHVIQRKFMEAMTRGTQKDLVAFITGLLRRSVRSVGTNVKPTTSDFSMNTSSTSRGHSVGVGDDSIDVVVKPWVLTRENFCTAKPHTRTQPTWTDLILTCDSSTNTQVNSLVQQDYRLASALAAKKELYTGSTNQTSDSGQFAQQRAETAHAMSSSPRLDQSASNNSTTTTTTTTTVQQSSNSGRRSQGSKQKKAKDISREYVDGLLGIGNSSNEQQSAAASQQVVITTVPDTRPEHLVEQKTEVTDDGQVSEVLHEVKTAPGVHAERTVRVTTMEGPDGSLSESVQTATSSHESSTTTTRVSLDNDSLLGANFKKHKEDMMRLLSGQQEEMTPISVDTSSQKSSSGYRKSGGSASSSSMSSTSTRRYSGGLSASSPLMHSPASSISPRGVIIEREGPAQRKYEEEMRKKNSLLSPSLATAAGGGMSMNGGVSGSSSSRHVTSTSDSHGDYSEVVQENESADGMTKELIIERSFTSSGGEAIGGGRYDGKLPDFSDYFNRDKYEPPPQGRAERMKRYENTSYSTKDSAEAERSKMEIAGDPLRARYNIDDLASPNSAARQETVTTTTRTAVITPGHTPTSPDSDDIPRSILKTETRDSSSYRNISFAEQATVAEVIDGEEIPVRHEDDDQASDNSESESEEEEEESFEEGTYEAKQGNVSYQCETTTDGKQQTASVHQSGLTGAKSQEEIDIDVELQAACSIVQQFIESGEDTPNTKVNSALSVIQQDWFKVASGQKASVNEVDGYMACFEDFSTDLLEHIVNMADGNGNTVLHYAVSHCNFPIVSLILDSGVSDVNLQNKAGYTPIMLAALAEVQSSSDRKAIQLLLSKGNVNLAASQPKDSTFEFKAGQTALMLAVSHGRHGMVELLLEAGADVNLQDEDGSTALMCATEHGHIDIVKTLLNHPEIDISLKDNDGSTALEIALENGKKEISMLLYAKDQAIKMNSTTSIRKRTSRIPSSGRSKSSSSRTTVVTRRRN